MIEALKDYPVVVECPVAWGEMDSFGHVNNIVYFRYFENARIAYFRETAVLEVMESSHIGPILASTECRFLVPLTYPDTVSTGTRVTDVGPDRFTMEYAVYSHRHQRLAAIGKGVLVTFDYASGTKASVPAKLRDRFEAMAKRGAG